MGRFIKAISVSLIGIVTLAGCLGPSGLTAETRQESVLDMRDAAIARLFRLVPEARTDLANSHGVGVFRNFGVNLFLASTANGYGVVEERRTGELTFMRMFSAGMGPGMGIKSYRAVLFFTQPSALQDFVTNGWDANLQSDVAARAGDFGGMFAASADMDPGIKLYQFTNSGLALQATIQGAKFWRDDELKSVQAAAGL